MPALTINHAALEKLCKINQFQIPANKLIFVGIRGCIPINFHDQEFRTTHPLSVIDINYTNPRCSIIQWRQNEKKLAAYPASTVPHITNVRKAKSLNGTGANCLFTGYYTDYRKGYHKPGSKTAHEAFRQNAIRPIRRTTDDLDYDHDDRVEYDNPNDNLHCGWFGSISSEYYASAGCQVVMGYPKCKAPNRTENTGPWRNFIRIAYASTQTSFPYILLNGLEVLNACNTKAKLRMKLRFGSSGKQVEAIQKSLKEQDYYEGKIDGDFGQRTMKSVVAFQKAKFGNEGADGIVGPMTAGELGVELPLV